MTIKILGECVKHIIVVHPSKLQILQFKITCLDKNYFKLCKIIIFNSYILFKPREFFLYKHNIASPFGQGWNNKGNIKY